MERGGKSGLCALSCSPKFIFWGNLRLGYWPSWNGVGRLTGTQRDSGPVQLRCDFRKLRGYSCVVPIGRETPWPEWQPIFWKTTQALLRAIECLRICSDWPSCSSQHDSGHTVTRSRKALNVAWFFLTQGSLAGLKVHLLPLQRARAQESKVFLFVVFKLEPY